MLPKNSKNLIRCLTSLLLVSTTVVLVCLWLWNRRKSHPNEPPELPGGLPLIGHAHLLFGNTTHLWNMFKKMSYESLKLGGVLKVKLGTRTVYIVTDPDDCLTLSNASLQKDPIYDFAKPWLGEGLVTGIPAVWKVHRKLLNPAFSQQVLNGFISVFNSQSRKLVNDLSCKVGQGPFDPSSYIHRSALKTIFLTAFGVNNNNKYFLNTYLHAFTEIYEIIVERFQNYLLHNNFIFNMSYLKKRQEKCIKVLHRISDTILKTRKANHLENKDSEVSDEIGVKFKPFMNWILELAIEKGAINDQEIREEVDTIIAAGEDTIATTLIFTMILIGSYPHVQEKIFAELSNVFGAEDRDVTKHDLSKLVYLEAVLKESMRLYPLVPVIARHIENDVKLSQYTVLGGTTCVFQAYGIHRHATWGPDAEDFKPERWFDTASLPKNAGAFAAFSVGRRACIGKTFALMSMKITLAHLMRNYTMKGDYTKVILKLNVTLKPERGHFIQIERRNEGNNKCDLFTY